MKTRTARRIDDAASTTVGVTFGLGIFAVCLAPFFGWLTHLYICFSTGAWGFLIAGAIFFPIGIIHGWGRWLGLW